MIHKCEESQRKCYNKNNPRDQKMETFSLIGCCDPIVSAYIEIAVNNNANREKVVKKGDKVSVITLKGCNNQPTLILKGSPHITEM